MKLEHREIRLKPAAYKAKYDQNDMQLWSNRLIDDGELAVRLSRRNNIHPQLTDDEAILFAHKCGYWELNHAPDWIQRDCDRYEIKHAYDYYWRGY